MKISRTKDYNIYLSCMNLKYSENVLFLKTLVYISIFICLFCVSILNVHAHTSESKDEVIVHMGEEGYKPEKLNIKVNTEVVFENVGKEEYWPASNDHPSHTLYDGTSIKQHCTSGSVSTFDACSPVKEGETWSFTFPKAGVYKYHDHLWPQFTGEIIVNDTEDVPLQNRTIPFLPARFLQRILYTISSFLIKNDDIVLLQSGNTNNDSFEDLKNRFRTIVFQTNPREAIHALRDESSKDNQTLALCHDILHVIGHAAYDKYGNFKESVVYQEDFCNSGYIHGLFESYFNSAEDPMVGLGEQCSDYAEGRRQFDLWQCHHGIGHGFMYLTGGDLDKSLQLCENGLKDEGAALSCQNGVYMEVFNMEILAKEKNYVNPDNPFLTCSSRAVAKGDCYLYIPTYLSQTLNRSFAGIFKECRKAEVGYRSICIGGIGSEAIKRNLNYPEGVFTLCKQAGSYTDQEVCVAGVVSMYMNQMGSYSAGKKLCEKAPESYQDICRTTVDSRESFFHQP